MTITVKSFASAWGTAAEGAIVNQQLVNVSPLTKLQLAFGALKPWAGRFAGQPDFVVEATTDASEAGKVADLDLKGFTPKTGYLYPVKIRHWARTENDVYFQEVEYGIVGSDTAGTDPLLLSNGGVPAAGGRNGNLTKSFGVVGGAAIAYGVVHTENVMGTGTTATKSSPGFTIANDPDGLDDTTIPTGGRLGRVIGVNSFDPAYTATDGQLMQFNPAGGTDSLQHVQADDGTSPQAPGAGAIMSITAEYLPPFGCYLSIDGTPDPGTVDVHVSGPGSDTATHRVEVFIGEPIAVPFTTGAED